MWVVCASVRESGVFSCVHGCNVGKGQFVCVGGVCFGEGSCVCSCVHSCVHGVMLERKAVCVCVLQ